MATRLYTGFTGLDLSRNPISIEQTGLLRCKNYIYNRVLNSFFKRGGSEYFEHGGDIWGLGGYLKTGSTLKVPSIDYPIRHRRVDTTSIWEMFNWSSRTWDVIDQGASTDFSVGAISGFAQIAGTLVLAAGRPARITNPLTTEIRRLGGPAPTQDITVTPEAGSLTGLYSWFYVFYDPDTGWTSSPSPVTSLTSLSSQNAVLSNLETSCDREGVGFKQIYRTASTGEQPHLLEATISINETSYTSGSVSDDNLGTFSTNYLGTELGLVADHNPPPEDCYIVAAHENRIWIASGTEIYYSNAYDGSIARLEEFSEERVFSAPQQITGLAPYRTGGMYVFTPPGSGIYEIQGRNQTSFSMVTSFPDEGTNYHSSVLARNGTVAYWGGSGPCLIGPQGKVNNFDIQVREYLREALQADYNQDSFVFTVYHEGSRQYLFGLAARSLTGAVWQEFGSGVASSWTTIDGMTSVSWGEA